MKSISLWLAMVVLLPIFGSCSEFVDTGEEDESCSEDSGCGKMLSCVDGVCIYNQTDGDNQTDDRVLDAWVAHFGSDEALGGITVVALDNDTGEPLAGFDPVVSDVNGKVTFLDLPVGKVGFLCQAAEAKYESVNTYQFNLKSWTATGEEEKLWSVDIQTYVAAPALGGLIADDNLAIIAGAAYWVDPASDSGIENIVGCADVSISPAGGDKRFFGDNKLPTTLEDRSDTNPLNGYYILANITPGQVTVSLDVDGASIGKTKMQVFDHAITIGNIYAGINPNYDVDAKSSITKNPSQCGSQ